jgi:peptidoglycan/xylan/chitin deacetylase (PgdA/CDA1 family)
MENMVLKAFSLWWPSAKKLADAGHEVAAHTWDHHMVTKYKGDWNMQLLKPKGLEKL